MPTFAFCLFTFALSSIRVSRKFDEGQTDAAHEEAISAHLFRRFEPRAAERGYEIVLIDSVAADPDGSDEATVLEERHAAGKYLNAIGYGRKRRTRRGQRVSERRAISSDASQNISEVLIEYQIQLQSVVERAEVLYIDRERPALGFRNAVGKERATQKALPPVAECDGAVEVESVISGRIDISAEARAAQSRGGIRVGEESRRARFLR